MFERMREEESNHRRRLFELYRERFGRREDVKGLVRQRPIWLMRPLRLEAVRQKAVAIEAEM